MDELVFKRHVEVCGVPYDVVEREDFYTAEGVHFGEIDFTKCIITLNKNAAPELKNQTLCHEMLHAIFVNLGYTEYSNDEQFVQAVASAINQSFVIKVY